MMSPDEILFKLKLANILSTLSIGLIFYFILHLTQWLSYFKNEPNKYYKIGINFIIAGVLSAVLVKLLPQIPLLFIDNKIKQYTIVVGRITTLQLFFLIIISIFFGVIIIRKFVFINRSHIINKDD